MQQYNNIESALEYCTQAINKVESQGVFSNIELFVELNHSIDTVSVKSSFDVNLDKKEQLKNSLADYFKPEQQSKMHDYIDSQSGVQPVDKFLKNMLSYVGFEGMAKLQKVKELTTARQTNYSEVYHSHTYLALEALTKEKLFNQEFKNMLMKECYYDTSFVMNNSISQEAEHRNSDMNLRERQKVAFRF